MKGFYSGFGAAFAVLALTSLLWVGLSISQRSTTDLLQWDAVAVSARAMDASEFLTQAMADSVLDSAYVAHGCQLGPVFCSAGGLGSRAESYARSASSRLSDRIVVDGHAELLRCSSVSPDAVHTQAYAVSISLTGVTKTGNVAIGLNKTVDFLVQLNASPFFEVNVNATPAWRLFVACPPPP